MSALNATQAAAALKKLYGADRKKALAYQKKILFPLIQKDGTGEGSSFEQYVRTRQPGGGSGTWSKARTRNTTSKHHVLSITQTAVWQRAAVNYRLFTQAKSARATMYKVSKEFDEALDALGAKIERRLFRGRTGKIGKISADSDVTTATITLDDRADVWNFAPGEVIVLSSTNGGGTLRNAGATIEVLSVDEVLGTVTFTGNVTAGIAAAAAGDTMFIDGDWSAANDICASGLEDWLPVDGRDAALAAAFYGLTRSGDPNRLGGIFVDGDDVAGDLNDQLIRLFSEMGRFSNTPDYLVVPTDAVTELQSIWQASNLPFVEASVNHEEGALTITGLASGVQVRIGQYKVTMLGSNACPSNRIYALDTSTWTIHHTGEGVPFFLNEDIEGHLLSLEKDGTEPEVAAYMGALFNLGCEAPGANGVLKVRL